ncbi:hypothetical protein EDD36DRAFT_429654, partial [Exophiala viscosa]
MEANSRFQGDHAGIRCHMDRSLHGEPLVANEVTARPGKSPSGQDQDQSQMECEQYCTHPLRKYLETLAKAPETATIPRQNVTGGPSTRLGWWSRGDTHLARADSILSMNVEACCSNSIGKINFCSFPSQFSFTNAWRGPTSMQRQSNPCLPGCGSTHLPPHCRKGVHHSGRPLKLQMLSQLHWASTAASERCIRSRKYHMFLKPLQAKDSVREKPAIDHVFRMRQFWLKAFSIAANATWPRLFVG